MKNIMNAVVMELEKRTDAIAPIAEKARQLQNDINGKQYSTQKVNNELYPRLYETRREIEAAQEETRRAVDDLVNKHIADLEQLDALNSADLTDDVRLLNAGITLNARDILTLLEKNAGNRTMQLILTRYAAEHAIDIGRVVLVGHEREIQAARTIPGTAKLFIAHHITKPNARQILDKMFRA